MSQSPEPNPEQRRQSLELWRAGNFPARHVEAIDSIGWTADQLDKVRDAQASVEANGILALVGGRGGGKTQLATMLARWFCFSQGRSVRYELAFLMLQDIKRKAYEEGKGGGGAIVDLVGVGLLVIDEVQEARGSDDDARWLVTLLDRRYAAKRGTILVSNLLPQPFVEAIGPSIASRLQETGRIIVLDWPSFRKGTA